MLKNTALTPTNVRPCLTCRRRTENPRYCSRRCAAIRNNHIFPKRLPEGRCSKCRKRIPTRWRLCDLCGTHAPLPGSRRSQSGHIQSTNTTPRTLALDLLGLALWWGEGSKDRHSVAVTNSDPDVILVTIRWLREVYRVPLRKFRLRLHIHETAHIRAIEAFWRKVTGVTAGQFHRPYIIPKKPKEPFHRLPYGVCRVSVYDVELFDLLCVKLEHIRGVARGSASPARFSFSNVADARGGEPAQPTPA